MMSHSTEEQQGLLKDTKGQSRSSGMLHLAGYHLCLSFSSGRYINPFTMRELLVADVWDGSWGLFQRLNTINKSPGDEYLRKIRNYSIFTSLFML